MREEEARGRLAKPGADKNEKNLRDFYYQLAEHNVRLTTLEVAKLNKRVAMLEGWVDTLMQHLAALGLDGMLVKLEANLPHLEFKDGVCVKEEI